MTAGQQGATFRRVFFVPLILALVSAAGLVSALLADGFWDALSWVTLGAPLAVAAWHLGRGDRRTT